MSETLIARRLHEAEKSNERARLVSYHCELPGECPLLAEGRCISLRFADRCVYGKIQSQTSKTRRARSYRDFVAMARRAMVDLLEVRAAEDRMAYVGDYVFLPYAHMNHADGEHAIPFLSHSHIFSNGSPFMPRRAFTPEMVVTLFRFRPRTFMDHNKVILKYVEVSLPKFLLELSEYDPGLYAAAVEMEPGIARLVEESRPTRLRVSELGGYVGQVEIEGHTYFRYSDGSMRGEVELAGLPTDGKVTVQFYPRPGTPCSVLDRKDAIRLRRRMLAVGGEA